MVSARASPMAGPPVSHNLNRAALELQRRSGPHSAISRKLSLCRRIVFVVGHEHADAPYAVALLRAGGKWPYRRAAEPGDEFAQSKANPHPPLTCEARARESYQGSIARPKHAVLTFRQGGGRWFVSGAGMLLLLRSNYSITFANPFTGLPVLQLCRPCLGARVLGGRWPPVGGWDVISVGASAAFALPSHCGQVTLAMSTVSSSCGAWTPQTARPLLVSVSSRLLSLVEYDQCR